jgi:hypothetical protein
MKFVSKKERNKKDEGKERKKNEGKQKRTEEEGIHRIDVVSMRQGVVMTSGHAGSFKR